MLDPTVVLLGSFDAIGPRGTLQPFGAGGIVSGPGQILTCDFGSRLARLGDLGKRFLTTPYGLQTNPQAHANGRRAEEAGRPLSSAYGLRDSHVISLTWLI
ncbi:MAG: hypothetical protein NXI19_02555 [Alphaproteobacteria bacterium]|nr:hypothetical protein [Alphaproteobacteria bacterium]